MFARRVRSESVPPSFCTCVLSRAVQVSLHDRLTRRGSRKRLRLKERWAASSRSLSLSLESSSLSSRQGCEMWCERSPELVSCRSKNLGQRKHPNAPLDQLTFFAFWLFSSSPSSSNTASEMARDRLRTKPSAFPDLPRGFFESK